MEVCPGLGERGPVSCADVTLHGRMRGTVYYSGHHGQWGVQVHGNYPTPQEQIWGGVHDRGQNQTGQVRRSRRVLQGKVSICSDRG